MGTQLTMLNRLPSTYLIVAPGRMPAMRWGERFQEVLQQTGISKAAFSRACGISKSAVSQWVDMNNPPQADFVVTVADLSGYAVRWLATGKGPKKLSDKLEVSKARELWDKYNGAPETARHAIDVLLDFRLESSQHSSAEDKKKNLRGR